MVWFEDWMESLLGRIVVVVVWVEVWMGGLAEVDNPMSRGQEVVIYGAQDSERPMM